MLYGVDAIISWLLRREVKGFLKQIDPQSFSKGGKNRVQIPEKGMGTSLCWGSDVTWWVVISTGLSKDQLLGDLEKSKVAETDPHSGKIFAYVYTTDNECFRVVEKALQMFRDASPQAMPAAGSDQDAKSSIVEMFYTAFLHENALNPLLFPSLRRFETETVSMVADMLHGDSQCVGSVTSGGSESILTAVKTYRDRAKKLFPSIKKPEIVRQVLSCLQGTIDPPPLPFSSSGSPPYHPPCLLEGGRLLWPKGNSRTPDL